MPLQDPWAFRAMLVCVRSLKTMPMFARDLVALLAADAQETQLAQPEFDSIRAR